MRFYEDLNQYENVTFCPKVRRPGTPKSIFFDEFLKKEMVAINFKAIIHKGEILQQFENWKFHNNL